MIRYSYPIPQHIQDDLIAYIAGKHPWPFGGFITAVLANDFIEAVARADMMNQRILTSYASFLSNELPGRTGDPTVDYWGSYEAVKNRIRDQITQAKG